MLKRIEIPKGLWEFVGHQLHVFGCIKVDEITDTDFSRYYEPKIRWLLLGNKDWKNYCSNIELFENFADNNKRLAEKEGVVNMCIKESIEKEASLEIFSERKQMIIEMGFIEFDNVILMREEHAKEKYNEANELFLKEYQVPIPLSLDGIRFQVLIEELIQIYKIQFGKAINHCWQFG